MNYKNLLLMTLLSFITMFILMYMMVDTFAHVYININQFYMAGIMTMPMVLIELLVMRSMYPHKVVNVIIAVCSMLIFVILLICLRQQIAIHDKEFLKGMIPHHAAALLMCKKATVEDPEIKLLCHNITKSQQEEIDFMQAKLAVMK